MKEKFQSIYRKYRRTLSAGLFFLGLVYLAGLFRNLTHELDLKQLLLSPSTLIIIVLLSTISFIANFFCWYIVANRGRNHSLRESYVLFCISSISRYLPLGKFVQFASMHQLTTDKAEKWNATYSLLVSYLLAVAAGALVALPGLARLFPGNNFLISLSAAFLCALIVRGVSQGWLITFLGKVFKKFSPTHRTLPFGTVTGVLLTYALFAWLGEAGCCLLFLQSVGETWSWSSLGFILMAYFVASAGGYLAFVVPNGLGVRDGILIALLKTRFSAVNAVGMTLMLRFGLLVGEAIFYLPLLFQISFRKRLAPRHS